GSAVRRRPADLPGPDRGSIPGDSLARPRASRGPTAPGGRDRLHGGLRRLGAPRSLAVPGAGAGRPSKEAPAIPEPRGGGIRIGTPTPPPDGELVAVERPSRIPPRSATHHRLRIGRTGPSNRDAVSTSV